MLGELFNLTTKTKVNELKRGMQIERLNVLAKLLLLRQPIMPLFRARTGVV